MKGLITRLKLCNFSVLDNDEDLLKASDKAVCNINVDNIEDLKSLTKAWIDLFARYTNKLNLVKLATLILIYMNNIYYYRNEKICKMDNKYPYYKYISSLFDELVSNNFKKFNIDKLLDMKGRYFYHGQDKPLNCNTITYQILRNTFENDSQYIQDLINAKYDKVKYANYVNIIKTLIKRTDLI